MSTLRLVARMTFAAEGFLLQIAPRVLSQRIDQAIGCGDPESMPFVFRGQKIDDMIAQLDELEPSL